MISIESRTAGNLDKSRRERSDFSRTLRVAIPGVVTEVDYAAQTVSVQPPPEYTKNGTLINIGNSTH